jgi:uncharacterized protein (DUF1800 family)
MSGPLPADTLPLDPERIRQLWLPPEKQPWNVQWAAHLFRRAAFGAGPEQLARAVRDGFEVTLQRLLDGEPDRARHDPLLTEIGDRLAAGGEIDDVRGWWVYVMLHGGHPLREKLTLFWHNHFATSVDKVRSAALMYRQNGLLRRHALGAFDPLLQAIGRDPAMLIWLDSNSNVKSRPNENYAREVMELFSLGVGHYTEKDIREAARAFTGRHISEEQSEFAFNADEHDPGVKTILGRSGRWDGDDVVRILLDQPATARFLVGKLYREFISETAPPPALLEPLVQRFRASGYRIDDLVSTMLRSRLFFSEVAFLRRIKSPVEFVLGAVRSAWSGPPQPTLLVGWMNDMGQALFAPPNVKGWPGGRAWINSSRLLARDNFAEALTTGDINKSRPAGARFDVGQLIADPDSLRPAELAGRLLELFLPGHVPPPTREKIADFLGEGRPRGKQLRERIREAAHAVLCLAEYQLC